MALETVESLEAAVQKAEEQVRAGNPRLALESYCDIFQERWMSVGDTASLTAADLTVLERIAEISIPFGLTLQADELFESAAQGYLRLRNRFWFDYITLKRVHLAFGSNAVFRARQLLAVIQPSLGDLEGISLDPEGFASLERAYKATNVAGERQIFFANLYLQLGRLALVLGLYRGAVQALRHGLTHTEESAPLSARSACLPLRLTLVRALLESGELNAALSDLDAVRRELNDPKHIGLLSKWLETSAQLALLRGDFSKAKEQLTQVWQICVSCGYLVPALSAFLNLAQLLILLNKTVEAKRLLARVQMEAEEKGLAEILADATRLQLVADARAQRDVSGPDSVFAAQAGYREISQKPPSAIEFHITREGFSYQDFQLRVLQFQFYQGSGRQEAARKSLERLRPFDTSDSRLTQLGLAAARASYFYFNREIDKALLLARQAAAGYRKLGMKPDQWRSQMLWKACLDKLGACSAERDALSLENEGLLTQMADALSVEERIVFLLNKPTQQEEKLARKIRSLQDAAMAPNATGGSLLSVYRQLRELNMILDEVYWAREEMTKIRMRPGSAPVKQHSQPSLMSRLLSCNWKRAFLAFIVLPDSVLIVTITFGRLRYRIVQTSRLRIRELVRAWHETVAESRPDNASRISRLLAQELQLESILMELPRRVKRLSIVPDDVLHGFPFAALKVGDQYVIERYPLSIAFQLNRRRVKRVRGVTSAALVVGMTEGSPPLPQTFKQVNSVAKWLSRHSGRVTLLLNEQAEPATLLDQLKKTTFFHISCHGEYTQDRPEATGWQIATAPGKVEIVGLDRMYELDLRGLYHATLISCWGADNFVFPGRWVTSLPEVLWRAGAGSVAGSLWQVSEDCATEFVERFYTALPGRTVDCAMQVAILGMIGNSSGVPREPFDWAGFQLYGQPEVLRF